MVSIFGIEITRVKGDKKKRKQGYTFTKWDREKASLIRQGIDIDEKKHRLRHRETSEELFLSDRELINMGEMFGEEYN